MKSWKRNLIALWIAQIFSISGFQFIIPFLSFFIQELGITDENQIRFYVGVISAMPALLMAGMAVVWGIISDKIGKKIMLLRAIFFGTLIMLGMSFARSIIDVIVLRALQGLLTGTLTASTTLVAAGTPKHSRSKALGFFASSAFIGLTLGPFIGGIAAATLGYRMSFMIGAAALACAFFLVLFLVKEVNTPPSLRKKEGKRSAPLGMATLPLLGSFILIFIIRSSRALVLPYTALYVQDIVTVPAEASLVTGNLIALMGIVTAIAGIFLVRLEGRFTRRTLLTTYISLATLCSIPIFLQHTIFGFAAFTIPAMFFVGGATPLVQASIADHLSRDRQGIAFGLQTMIGGFGWFIAPLAGAGISIRYNIASVFVLLSLLLVAASVVGYLVFERKHERKV